MSAEHGEPRRAQVAGEVFSTREVARLARLTPDRVRRFVYAGVLRPGRGRGRRFEFALRDLRLLRASRDLLAAGLGPRRVADVVRNLATQLPPGRDVGSVKLKIDEHGVLATDGRRTWRPASGQLLFAFDGPTRQARVRRIDGCDADEAEAAALEAFARGSSLEARAPAEAKAAYREVLRIDPRGVPALVNLGRLEHESGNLAEAERLYFDALAIDPDERTAAFNLAVLAEDRGDTRLAIRRYERALRVAPDLADAHQRLARLRAAVGDRGAARRHTLLYRSLLRGGG